MSSVEMEEMFEQDGENARVRSQFREGISLAPRGRWRPKPGGEIWVLQDIVVANRFLCHMPPEAAEACLRDLARLVKSGGYLFVSGVDLAVRSKVASESGWRPVIDLIAEIHEGDPTLRRDWPLEYWGLEPLDKGRKDWKVRYASVFRLPGHAEISKTRKRIWVITTRTRSALRKRYIRGFAFGVSHVSGARNMPTQDTSGGPPL